MDADGEASLAAGLWIMESGVGAPDGVQATNARPMATVRITRFMVHPPGVKAVGARRAHKRACQAGYCLGLIAGRTAMIRAHTNCGP